MNKLIKPFYRISIILISLYFSLAFILAQFFGLDVMTNFYFIPIEFGFWLFCNTQGKYHCRHIRHLALSIFISDTITITDNYFDYLSVDAHNLIPLNLIFLGFMCSLISAIKHFIKVQKIKSKRNGIK